MPPDHADLRHTQAILGHASLRTTHREVARGDHSRGKPADRVNTVTSHALGVVFRERHMAMHERISISPDVCDGQAWIKGKRILVHLIAKMLANGDTIENLLNAYPTIAREDIPACLAHAGELADQKITPAEASTQ